MGAHKVFPAHPLRVAAATGCAVVVSTELALHAPNDWGVIVACSSTLIIFGLAAIILRRHRSRAQLPSAAGPLLVAETEAFLSGDYARYLRSRRHGVPGWAWLNSFAHGQLPSLLETQRSPHALTSVSRSRGTDRAWLQAQSILGRDLLKIVQDDPQRLVLVQQSTLVPLELRLMEREATGGLTAYELVQATRDALRPSLGK